MRLKKNLPTNCIPLHSPSLNSGGVSAVYFLFPDYRFFQLHKYPLFITEVLYINMPTISSWQEQNETLRLECERWKSEATNAITELNVHKAKSSIAIASPLQNEMKKLRDDISMREVTLESTISDKLKSYEAEKDLILKELEETKIEKEATEKIQQELEETKTQLARKTAEVSEYLTKSTKAERELSALKKQIEVKIAASILTLQRQLNTKTGELANANKRADEEVEKGLSLKRKCTELTEAAAASKSALTTATTTPAAATTTTASTPHPSGMMLRSCTYRTNETGWRKGQIVGLNSSKRGYNIKDTEKGWVLQDWPFEHVRIDEVTDIKVVTDCQDTQPTKRHMAAIPTPIPPAQKIKPAPAPFSMGDEAEGNFNGEWFRCVVREVQASSCNVQWVEDSSFTPNIPFSNLRRIQHKPAHQHLPKHIPQQIPRISPPAGRGINVCGEFIFIKQNFPFSFPFFSFLFLSFFLNFIFFGKTNSTKIISEIANSQQKKVIHWGKKLPRRDSNLTEVFFCCSFPQKFKRCLLLTRSREGASPVQTTNANGR